MRRGFFFQISLIVISLICFLFLAVFFYRELYPEYKMYQKDYLALEEFRSSYTRLPPPPFSMGVKQILIEKDDKGNPTIDRCISCHVALQIPYFSPTRIAKDMYGNILINANGFPMQEKNPDYIWDKLDQEIASLTDEKIHEQLKSEGKEFQIKQNLKKAETLKNLKVAHVGDHTYDVTKVLRMHPLMGRETRPFEYHPINEYGCVSCHSGNGRGLTTEKAHGPIFDEQYEITDMGPKREFLEKDPANDPLFAKMFNDKPGSHLLFQTKPLFLGNLIEAKCANCHQLKEGTIFSLTEEELTENQIKRKVEDIKNSLISDKNALFSLTSLYLLVEEKGFKEASSLLLEKKESSSISQQEKAEKEFNYLQTIGNHPYLTFEDIQRLIGEKSLTKEWILQAKKNPSLEKTWKMFYVEHFEDPDATGSLFLKENLLKLEQDLVHHSRIAAKTPVSFQDEKSASKIIRDIDLLTQNFSRGKELFFSQACYTCHRISGLSRGGVGPELTEAGELYPWYLKESIVWPQADLPSSTMPNMRLDHLEVEDLMTFLLAQKKKNLSIAETAYKIGLQAWEAGKKLPWEKPIPPEKMYDVDYAMTVFATEGCASCHMLKGYQSEVGFSVEKKEEVSFSSLYAEKTWFSRLFPEDIQGSNLVQVLEKNQNEIDQRISPNVRKRSILEKIEKEYPNLLSSFNASFRFAERAKNAFYKEKIKESKTEEEKTKWTKEWDEWQKRVHLVLMMYIQEYGLGRLIGPRPNWSGVYRTDEWLIQHFQNPTSHVPGSIMPAFPFDDTKFFSLTHMLDVLGLRNRNELRRVWKETGFNPEKAYETLCSQCHGPWLQGNGPVSEWLYPIPKNLRNAEFLRNLSKDKAKESIHYGVAGTPMPPWGVAAKKPDSDGQPVLTEPEIDALVDWIFSTLPGGRVIQEKEIKKWQYGPEDILEELKREKDFLLEKEGDELSFFSQPTSYFASLTPLPKEMKQEENQGNIHQIFNEEEVKRPDGTVEEKFYIQPKFYTEKNIQEGEAYFILNCSVCHGKEGTGAGPRAETMLDAKPRMFTNLDWLDYRDDLRLLRSIKYGVPGTSMVAWGDQTTALQRLQLVMYIRSLSTEQKKRRELEQSLYEMFENALLYVNREKAEIAKKITFLEEERRSLSVQEFQLLEQFHQGKTSSEKVLETSEKIKNIEEKLLPLKESQELFTSLKTALKEEENAYFDLGNLLLQKKLPEKIFNEFLSILSIKKISEGKQYQDKNFTLSKEEEIRIEEKKEEIQKWVKEKVDHLKKRKKILEGKVFSSERLQQEQELEQEIFEYENLVKKMQKEWEKISSLEKKKNEILKQIQNGKRDDRTNLKESNSSL